jgi:hypothetical protein
MPVLIENASNPPGDREEEHIVTIGGWPIWNCHSSSLGCNDPPAAEQDKGRKQGEYSPNVD